MSNARSLSVTVYAMFSLIALVGFTGCGGTEKDSAPDADGEAFLSKQNQDGEGSGNTPDLAADDRTEEAGEDTTPGLTEGSGGASLSNPRPMVAPFSATAPAPGGAMSVDPESREVSPPVSALPKMAIRPREMDTASPPRLTAPMALAPAPKPALAARDEANPGPVAEPVLRMAPPPEETAVPRMAEMSREPVAGAAPPEAFAMEMAAPPEAAEEAPQATREPIADDRGDYEVVTVFYGTDRSSNTVSGQPAQPHRLWFYAAGVCALLFGLFALVAMSSSRKKTFASLSVISFSAGSVLAVMGTIAWLQRDGAVAGPNREYGNGRGEFVMGTCEVSIPRTHQVAELEAPSVFKLDFVEDPTKHVVLLDIEEKDPKNFFAQLRDRVDQSVTKDAFVFIHGFNVTFKDAARRTAQLAYDLKFQGAPIFYSWPSQGGLFQYAVDETNVVWTVPHLQQFLKDVAKQSGASSVHLIAHSMGNRALTSALRELSLEMQGTPPLFHEVVLTAPDIDAEIFRRDIAPAIVPTAKRVTLYASSNDEALVLSKQVHGYPRAGDSGDGLVVIPGIETIDVSAVDTSLVGHTYYGDNATVISDMIDLVRNSKSAKERSWLETARLDDLFYWIFRPDRAAVGSASTDARSRY